MTLALVVSMLVNQFVPSTFCLYFAFTGINFRGISITSRLRHAYNENMSGSNRTRKYRNTNRLINYLLLINPVASKKKCITWLKTLSLRCSQNSCRCPFTQKKRQIQHLSQAARGTSKQCWRSLRLGDRSMMNVQFLISARRLYIS